MPTASSLFQHPHSGLVPQHPSREASNSLLRCSSFCRNFRSRSEGMANEMPDVTFMVFTPITSPSCMEKGTVFSNLHLYGALQNLKPAHPSHPGSLILLRPGRDESYQAGPSLQANSLTPPFKMPRAHTVPPSHLTDEDALKALGPGRKGPLGHVQENLPS